MIKKEKTMKKHYHTKVKASAKFWKKQLRKQIIHNTDSKITEIDGDEITIESNDCTAEQDIIKLSEQNPDKIFEAKYTVEDHFENLVATYQYLNGTRKFIKEEYEYLFGINLYNRDKIDPQIYDRFKQKITEHFKKIDNYRIRTSEKELSFQESPIICEDKDDILLTSIVEYIDGDIILTAKKFGLTYLDVTVKFMENSPENTVDDFTEREYNNVPF